jgi:hypothetical protein
LSVGSISLNDDPVFMSNKNAMAFGASGAVFLSTSTTGA